jgi:hypothetical protein
MKLAAPVFSSMLRNENSRKTTRVFHGFRKGENSKRPIRNMKLTNPSKPSTVVCAFGIDPTTQKALRGMNGALF